MGAEFLIWKYRPTLLVTMLFFIVCKMHLTSTDSSVAPVGKLYPRGNHWAVGHLMGKKSAESVDGKTIGLQPLRSPDQDEWRDLNWSASSLLSGLIRALTGQERREAVAAHGGAALHRKRVGGKTRRRGP